MKHQDHSNPHPALPLLPVQIAFYCRAALGALTDNSTGEDLKGGPVGQPARRGLIIIFFLAHQLGVAERGLQTRAKKQTGIEFPSPGSIMKGDDFSSRHWARLALHFGVSLRAAGRIKIQARASGYRLRCAVNSAERLTASIGPAATPRPHHGHAPGRTKTVQYGERGPALAWPAAVRHGRGAVGLDGLGPPSSARHDPTTSPTRSAVAKTLRWIPGQGLGLRFIASQS